MADSALSNLTSITTPASGDLIYIVDVSDTTDSASGSSRQITLTNLFAQVDDLNSSIVTLTGTQILTNKTLTSPTITSPTITGTIVLPKTLEINDTTGDHQYVLAVSELAADRTITLPLLTTADTFVFADFPQVLTAKQMTNMGVNGIIYDANSNEWIRVTSTTNAVNDITYANATTGNNPTVTASGSDDNVGINLTPKGTGKIQITANDLNLSGSSQNIQSGGADPWRTITLTPGFLKPATTSPCATVATVEAGTNDIDYDVLDFDASSDEVAFANFQMPDSWDAGTIQFRYIWTNASGLTTETLQFELSGRSFANDDAIDQAVGTAVAVDDTWIAQGDIHISAWSGDVTLAGGPAAGEWVHLELMRDVSDDTLTGDARLIALQIRYKQGAYSD